MTLHGKGDQYWCTEDYEEKRRKALKDRSKYNDDRLEKVDLNDKPSLGGGKTDDDTYTIKQFPYPQDQSIRRRKKVDLREVDKRTGGNK